MSFIKIRPVGYGVNFTGAGYHYVDRNGLQVSNDYKTLAALEKYGKVIIWE